MELRAFIGHSFSDGDDPVVRAFLDYFDQLQGMSFGFSWDHAKVAEPKILAEKVLSLIQGRNLFIGICTKKELVIERDKLREGRITKELKSTPDNFYWKTSDWIIQEIGLAIGKGMNLILLVEEGLRPPGGLQGNLEYIAFDRQAPEKSFGKILEMIRSLFPTSELVRGEEQRTEAAPDPGKVAEKESSEDILTPKPEWRFVDYSSAFIHAMVLDNAEAVKLLADAYLETVEGRQLINKIRWLAYQIYWKAFFGKVTGSITALESLAEEHPRNEYCFYYLAKAYEDFKEYKKAAENYSKSADLSQETNFALLRLKDAANAWVRADDTKSAEHCLTKILSNTASKQGLDDIALETKMIIAEKEENKDQSLALLECWLDLHPDDSSKRFEVAYKYSQSKYDSLALLHYTNIPYLERKGGAWNNLGVQYNHFSLYSKSIGCYKKAADEYNETLAMSNIANKFLYSGFIKEAEEMCKKAMTIEDYHKNIVIAITKLRELPEQEDEKEKEILTKTRKLKEFFVSYGKAMLNNAPSSLDSNWTSPNCPVSVTLKNGEFIAEGSYEVKGLGATLLQQETQVNRFKVIYTGKLTGMSIQGTMVIDRDDEPKGAKSLLGIDSNKHEIIMVINDTLDIIDVYDKNEPENARFSQLTKI